MAKIAQFLLNTCESRVAHPNKACEVIALALMMRLRLERSNGYEMTARNPYSILNLEKSADSAQIKKKYRQLAKKLHPDQNTDDPTAHKSQFCTRLRADR